VSAAPDAPADGTVIESRLDKGLGPVFVTVIRDGTLNIGDTIVVGRQHGKVRALLDHTGTKLLHAPPSAPVWVVGLRDVPQAGDTLIVVPSDEVAWALVKKRVAAWDARQQRMMDRNARGGKGGSGKREGKSLAVVVKSDVFGTLSAVTDALEALTIPEVHVQVVDKGVGPVSSGDIDSAAANGAFIVTFNVKTAASAQTLASQASIPILSHKIIYHLLDDVRERIVQLLPPLPTTDITGKMRVLQVWPVLRWVRTEKL
jgi:translation initiation factor IF-2